MGTWTDEFVNVSRVTEFDQVAQWLRTAVIDPIRSARAGGREVPFGKTVLYFPPGDWFVVTAAGSPLVLPPEVEVRVAPGGRVVVLGGGYLEIQGRLKAPIGPIFATFSTRPPGTTIVGKVRLTGESLDRVYPEWWGAGVRKSGIFRDEDAVTPEARGALLRDDEIDTEALEEALRAAVDRTPTGGVARNPLIVELPGRYRIRRPLTLGVVEVFMPPPPSSTPTGDTWNWRVIDHGTREISLDSPAELEIRGRLGPPEEATLTCSGTFPSSLLSPTPMLHLGAAVSSARLHAVSFDARGRGSHCVHIDLPGPREATQVPFELHMCRFKGARQSLLSMDWTSWRTLRASTGMQASSPAILRAAVPTLQAEGCVFTPQRFPDAIPLAVRLVGPAGSSSEFRACTFAGDALAMIHASSVTLVVSGCRFENTMIPERLRSSNARDAWAHANGPEGGVDVYLDEAAGFVTPRPNAPGVTPTSERFEMGSISAQDCRSTSPQFLVTTVPQGASSARDGTVIGLHHDFKHAGIVPSRSKPPAIFWRVSATALGAGATLILTGCRFDGVVPDGAARVIAEGTTLRPALIDCGICSGDTHLRDVTDPLRVPGLISTPVLGDVPPRH